jgi:hypothetical protein
VVQIEKEEDKKLCFLVKIGKDFFRLSVEKKFFLEWLVGKEKVIGRLD